MKWAWRASGRCPPCANSASTRPRTERSFRRRSTMQRASRLRVGDTITRTHGFSRPTTYLWPVVRCWLEVLRVGPGAACGAMGTRKCFAPSFPRSARVAPPSTVAGCPQGNGSNVLVNLIAAYSLHSVNETLICVADLGFVREESELLDEGPGFALPSVQLFPPVSGKSNPVSDLIDRRHPSR